MLLLWILLNCCQVFETLLLLLFLCSKGLSSVGFKLSLSLINLILEFPNSLQILFLFKHMQNSAACFMKSSHKRLKEVGRLHKVSPSSIFSKIITETGGKNDSVDTDLIFLDVKAEVW